MEALRSRPFWLIGTAFGLQLLGWTGVMAHFVPAIEDRGYSTSAAASLVSVYGFASIPARLVAGYIADRVEKRLVIMGFMALFSAAMVVLATATSLWQFALFAVMLAWGASSAGSMIFPMIGDYFGRRSFGTLAGMCQMLMAPGLVLGVIIAGNLRDATGSYTVPALIFAGAGGMGVALLGLAGTIDQARVALLGRRRRGASPPDRARRARP